MTAESAPEDADAPVPEGAAEPVVEDARTTQPTESGCPLHPRPLRHSRRATPRDPLQPQDHPQRGGTGGVGAPGHRPHPDRARLPCPVQAGDSRGPLGGPESGGHAHRPHHRLLACEGLQPSRRALRPLPLRRHPVLELLRDLPRPGGERAAQQQGAALQDPVPPRVLPHRDHDGQRPQHRALMDPAGAPVPLVRTAAQTGDRVGAAVHRDRDPLHCRGDARRRQPDRPIPRPEPNHPARSLARDLPDTGHLADEQDPQRSTT